MNPTSLENEGLRGEVANSLLEAALAVGPQCGTSHVIAIDGPTGSGKTTLAAEVRRVALARALTCVVLHTDDICPGWNGLPQVPGIAAALLRQLATHGKAVYPTWDWHQNSAGQNATICAADVVIVEGVGSGAQRCADYVCATRWLDAPVEIRKARVLARDGDAFMFPWDAWAVAEHEFFTTEGNPNAVGRLMKR